MTLRESIEKADKRLELMGFDSIDKAIIYNSGHFFHFDVIGWILTATDQQINDWYESLEV